MRAWAATGVLAKRQARSSRRPLEVQDSGPGSGGSGPWEILVGAGYQSLMGLLLRRRDRRRPKPGSNSNSLMNSMILR